jgi:hypothetical protein
MKFRKNRLFIFVLNFDELMNSKGQIRDKRFARFDTGHKKKNNLSF